MTIADGITTSPVSNNPIFEKKIVFSIVAADTGASKLVGLNGDIRRVVLVVPTMSGNSNLETTLTFVDANGITIKTLANGVSVNDTYIYELSCPVNTSILVKLAFQEAAGTTGDFVIYLTGVRA